MQFLLGQTTHPASGLWVSVKDILLTILATGAFVCILQHWLGMRARRRERREELPGLLISQATLFLHHLARHMRFNDLVAFYEKGATVLQEAATKKPTAKESALRYGKSALFYQEKAVEQGSAMHAVEAEVLNTLAELGGVYRKRARVVAAIDDLRQAVRDFECDLPFDKKGFATISLEEARLIRDGY